MDSPRKRRRIEQSFGEKSKSEIFPPVETIENGEILMKYKCKHCPDHKRPINATKIGNLGSHLERVHPLIFANITKNKKESLPIKRLRTLQNAVEIVSVNGRPFKCLLDSGYQSEIENKLRKFRDAGMAINFSNPNLPEIKKHLSSMADKVREKI